VKNKSNSTTIAKSAGAVGVAVMISRVLGLIREQVFAALFGAGTANDAFVVAFRIPNLLRDLFGEGALSTAFVKVFTEYDQKGDIHRTWQLASIVLIFFGCLLSLLTLIAIFFSEPLVKLFVPEFMEVPGKMELTILLTRVMMPFLVFISLSSVVMGILNTRGKFFIPALASSFFNLGSIIGGVSLSLLLPRWGYPAIVGMAIGTLFGGVLQFLIQIPSLKQTGFRFSFSLRFKNSGLIKIITLMIPAIIGLSATQINVFINTSFASSCQEGSVSWLQYSFRLVQLPIGIFGVAVGIAAMPLLSRHAAQGDKLGLKSTFVSSQTIVFCLTIPAAAGLFILAEPIIQLIFERGAFSQSDTIMTAQALSLYSLGLFAYSSNKVLVPVFYAIEKTIYPVIASFLAIITNIVFVTLTIDLFQHRAIALSMSVTMCVNFIFLNMILFKQLNGFNIRQLLVSLGKIVVATLCMAGFLITLKQHSSTYLQGSLLLSIASLFVLISSAVIVYAAALYIMKVEEFSYLIQQFKHKLRQ